MHLSDREHILLDVLEHVRHRCDDWTQAMSTLHDEGEDTTEWDYPACIYFPPAPGEEESRGVLIERFFTSQRTKQMFFDNMLPGIVKELSDRQGYAIDGAVITDTAWMAEVNASEGVPDKRVSELPDRQEIVFIIAINADRVFDSRAIITRTPDSSPTIGEWTDPLAADNQDAGKFGGAIVDAVRLALASPTGSEGGDSPDN